MNKEWLRKANIYEVFIKKIINNILNIFNKKKKLILKKIVNENQVSFIARSLGEMYKDGIPIDKAVILLEECVSHREYKNTLKTIYSAIHNGQGLSESFNKCKPLYPELFIGLIFIGENTGKLYEILKILSDFYERIYEIKSEIKIACIYPLFIMISIVIFIGIFVSKIIPSFYDIYTSMGIEPSHFSVI